MATYRRHKLETVNASEWAVIDMTNGTVLDTNLFVIRWGTLTDEQKKLFLSNDSEAVECAMEHGISLEFREEL